MFLFIPLHEWTLGKTQQLHHHQQQQRGIQHPLREADNQCLNTIGSVTIADRNDIYNLFAIVFMEKLQYSRKRHDRYGRRRE